MVRFFFTFKSSTSAGAYFKKSRALILAASIGGAAFSATGCESPRGTDMAQLYRQPPPTLSSVNYATLRADMLAPQCISCHADFGSESGLLKYVIPGDATSSPLYRAVANGSMPPGGPPLSGAAADMFKTYIEGLKGAPEASSPPVITTPQSPDYALIRAKILVPHCLQCHSGFGTAVGLAPYVVAGEPEKSVLIESIVNGSMPPGGPAIEAEDLALLKKYILNASGPSISAPFDSR